MIDCMVVDDELAARTGLIRLLERHCPEVRVVGDADSVMSAREGLSLWCPQLVFLDIAMPMQDGFELLADFEDRPFEVIFVTAHGHHAIRALRLSAVDYLLKPVVADELKAAVAAAARRLAGPASALARIQTMLGNMQEGGRKKLAIPDVNGVTVVRLADIVRLEAADSSTQVILEDGRTLVASRPLRTFEDLGGDDTFLRVHASHVVNLAFVERYERTSGGHVVMSDGSTVAVARRRRQELLDQLERD